MHTGERPNTLQSSVRGWLFNTAACIHIGKVQVGNDQEKAQSERISYLIHNCNIGTTSSFQGDTSVAVLILVSDVQFCAVCTLLCCLHLMHVFIFKFG